MWSLLLGLSVSPRCRLVRLRAGRLLLIVALGALVGCVITFTGLLINLFLWPARDGA